MTQTSQMYDTITRYYCTADQIEYVGDGNGIGHHATFLVDAPNFQAGDVIWFDHTRRLGEGSKLLNIVSPERIEQLMQERAPKEV